MGNVRPLPQEPETAPPEPIERSRAAAFFCLGLGLVAAVFAFLGPPWLYPNLPEYAAGSALPCSWLAFTVWFTASCAATPRIARGPRRELRRLLLIGLPGAAIAGVLSAALASESHSTWHTFQGPLVWVSGPKAVGSGVALATLALAALGQALFTRPQQG